MRSLIIIIIYFLFLVGHAEAVMLINDSFEDSSINTALWVEVDSGANVNETGGALRLIGTDTWGVNGVRSVGTVSGTYGDIYFKFHTLSSKSNNGLLVGWEDSTGLNYTGVNFELFMNYANLKFMVNGTVYDSGYDLEYDTTYEVRMRTTPNGTTVLVKGGLFASWTLVYTSTWNSVLSKYIHIQIYDDNGYYYIYNFSAFEYSLPDNFFDDFSDASIDIALWNETDTGTNITEAGGVLTLTGNGSWDQNGLRTDLKNYSQYGRIDVDLTTPSSLAGGTGILIGFDDHTVLSYTGNNFFFYLSASTVYAHINSTNTSTGETLATSTTYNLQIIWDETVATPTCSIKIKGGSWSDWTTIYNSTDCGKHLYGTTVQTQVISSAVTYTLDNFRVMDSFGVQNYHVVGIGDSLMADGSILTRLRTLQKVNTLNSGISGKDTTYLLTVFDSKVIGPSATQIYLQAGTNDYCIHAAPNSVADVRQNILDMLVITQDTDTIAPNMDVSREFIISEVPPVTSRSCTSGLTAEQMQGWSKLYNAEYRKLCIENNLKLAPSYQELAYNDPDHEDEIAAAYDSDGVHFTASGYQRIGDMYNVAAIPTRMYRWGVAEYGVDDESWDWWILSGSASISGDGDTGTLVIPQNDYAVSTVKCIESGDKRIHITPNIDSGTAIIQYRTSTNNFDRDAGTSWSNYTNRILTSDQFVQIKIIGESATDLNITDLSMTWDLPGDSNSMNIPLLVF